MSQRLYAENLGVSITKLLLPQVRTNHYQTGLWCILFLQHHRAQ